MSCQADARPAAAARWNPRDVPVDGHQVGRQRISIIAAKQISADIDYAIGRAFESAWLQATVEELAAQPMMSVFVLKNILAHADELPEEVNKIGRQAAEKVIQAFNEALALSGQIHSGDMLRIGHAPPPTVRVGRLA